MVRGGFAVLWLAVGLAAAGGQTFDTGSGPPGADGEIARIWKLTGDLESSYALGSDLDGASDSIDVWSNRLALRYSGPGWPGALVGFGLSYEYRNYDFDGNNTFFAGTDRPFEHVRIATLSVDVLQALSDSWGLLIRAGVSTAAEIGADAGDGIAGQLILGIGHQFCPSFRAGIGVAAFTRLEDSILVVPVIQLDWMISEEWRFQILGPGGELRYTPLVGDEPGPWDFSLSLGFDGARFRLDDEPDTNESIVQDFRIPASFRARYRPSDDLTLGVRFGVDLHREFEIEDRNGDNRREFDGDPGVFFGLSLTYVF